MDRLWMTLAALLAVLPAAAWGPHPAITQAALDVLPERDRWDAAYGADNLNALTSHCWMPDQRGQDLGAFYADDYLLTPLTPNHVGHTMPSVETLWEPYFRRALQALRSETPQNALRQLGPLVHFTEDSGAPPHAKPKCPNHSEMENWIRADDIAIADYAPRLLGNTDEEALAGYLQRMQDLVAFSILRADRALPLVQAAEPDRGRVEPILLESANECARVLADTLYTLFTLAGIEQPPGATLEGAVTAAVMPQGSDHGARIVLLDSPYHTLATTTAKDGGWQGRFRLHHLPAGTYRVLAYRVGSQPVTQTVTLASGETASLDLALPPVDPLGNLVLNPDGRLSYLTDAPDRWSCRLNDGVWRCASGQVRIQPGTVYRCGAALADPATKVTFRFVPTVPKPGVETISVPLEPGAEVRWTADDVRRFGEVVVEGARPLTEAIERVWIVPEAGAQP